MSKPARPLLRIFGVLLLVVVQMGISLPVLPALTLALGGDAVDIGLLYACQSFGQFIAAPYWGSLSDRLGRRRVILITTLLVSLAEFATAFAPSLLVLYVCRLAVGFWGGAIATGMAYIADVTDVGERSRGMAVMGVSFGLGFTIGPGLGAALGYLTEPGAGPLGDGLPFLVASAIGLTNFFLAAAILREARADIEARAANRSRRPSLADIRILLNNRAVHAMLVLNFLYTVSASILESTFFVFAEGRYGWDERQVGMAFAGLGLLLAFLQGGVGRASARLGDRKMVATGLCLVGAGLFLAPFFEEVAPLLALLAVATAGRAFAHPGILAMTSATEPALEDAGRVMGALQSAASLGRIVGPAIGGALFAYVHPNAPFWTAGILVGLSLMWWIARTRR